jgi:flagellar hook-associated protein 2
MLPIRPVRRLKSYEEHLDFYRYSTAAVTRRAQSPYAHMRRKAASFPYAKEADIEAAERFAVALAMVLAAAATLKGLAEQLADPAASQALNRRAVKNGNPEAVQVKAESGAPVADYTLEIKRLAAPQISRTAFFAPDAPTTIRHGINRLVLATRHENKELQWLSGESMSHKTALTWLKNSINAADRKIRASLEKDPETGRIRLVLEAAASGADGAFFLQDLEGNMASATGLLIKDQTAADAQFRINGGDWQYVSDNHIILPALGLQLQLLSAAAGDAVFTVAPDWEHIREKLLQLNAAMDVLEQRLAQSADYLNPRFHRELLRLRETFPPEEELRDSGHLAEIAALLTGGHGLIPGLSALIREMESVPAEELLNRDNSRYKRYANYLASREWYSQLPHQGLLLNRFL